MKWLPAFGHIGIPFEGENDRPGTSSLQGHFETTQGRFLDGRLCFEAVVLLEVQWENCYTTWGNCYTNKEKLLHKHVQTCINWQMR